MKINRLQAASAMALASLSTPLLAQSMSMPGMKMPMSVKKPAAKKGGKASSRTPVGNAPAVSNEKSRAATARAREMADPALGATAPMPMPMPVPERQRPAPATPMPMGSSPAGVTGMPMAHDAGSGAAGMSMERMPMGDASHSMQMGGALGSYPEQRESSGTAWQPDASTPMSGPMLMSGEWMLMAHGTLNLVYDRQSGRRGDDKGFASGMLMGMARRPLGKGTVQLRAMVSPDPLMGASGYPLLLATGETADGKTLLVDRQHPHDLFMELAASISQELGGKSSIFLYGGLPGEPAFGPPAFMHRESILDSPEAPITHHWLDSTHISFGVVTAGLVLDRFKVEASRFNGREPDQHRWNIETAPLDSTSVRISWNPVRTIALQASWGHFRHPEELEPGVNQTRWSASALWADDVAPSWHAAASLAWGRKSSEGHHDDAIALEASIRHAGLTLFGRGEWIENRELLGLVESPSFKVGKLSLGAVRDFRIADHLSLGTGGLFSVNFVPDSVATLYGNHEPTGAMAFVRLKLD